MPSQNECNQALQNLILMNRKKIDVYDNLTEIVKEDRDQESVDECQPRK